MAEKFEVDPEQAGTLMALMVGGTPRRSRWQRLLAWFGLAPAEPRAYTHSFTPDPKDIKQGTHWRNRAEQARGETPERWN